ncbi:hypothetical protein [Candidatus Palauibacter sp.]|uniref:hypothetical protein n=1 Tax=Candidatus Palauibacter sp. TaxID=3101350 RepID=UPI003B5252AD
MPEPPEWEEIVAELESGECAAYWKRASGVYTVEFVEIDYSPEARSAPGEAVRVAEAVRPFGDVEGVYELLLRTACVAPDSEAAREELLDALETIFPDESAISADRAAPGIFEEDGALRRGGRTAPPRTSGGPALDGHCNEPDPDDCHEPHELAPLIVDVFRTPCPAGFDRDEVTGKCHRGFVGEGMGPVTGRIELYPIEPIRGWKVGRFKRGEEDEEDDEEATCTDDQIAIADEYEAAGYNANEWKCDVFTHSVKSGRGTHGHAAGYLTDSYISGSGTVLGNVATQGVTGATITSNWRCPEGNKIVGGTGTKHIEGRAGDFRAPGFLDEPDGSGATEEEEEVAKKLHAKFAAAAVAAGGRYTAFGHDGTHKDHIHIFW